MTKLEKLIDYAHQKNIDVYDTYSQSERKGACIACGIGSMIAINRRIVEDMPDKLCTFAEEIGHIETKAMLPVADYIHPAINRQNKLKNEAKAMQFSFWAILPPHEIQSALDDGCTCDEQIAEFCEVKPQFVREAVEYYATKGYTFVSDCA